MKVVQLPSQELRTKLMESDGVKYRLEQSKSEHPNHKEYGEAWLDGYKYGVDAILASFGPEEAMAQLKVLNQIKQNIDDLQRSLKLQVEQSINSKKHYEKRE